MSRRLKITLPDALATQLDELAANAGESVARLAGQMVRRGISEANAGEHVPAVHAQPAPVVLDTYNEDESEQRARCGSSPTVGTANGARGCGAGSSRCTAATPQRSPT